MGPEKLFLIAAEIIVLNLLGFRNLAWIALQEYRIPPCCIDIVVIALAPYQIPRMGLSPCRPGHIGAEYAELLQKILGLPGISGTNGFFSHKCAEKILTVAGIRHIIYSPDHIFIHILDSVVLRCRLDLLHLFKKRLSFCIDFSLHLLFRLSFIGVLRTDLCISALRNLIGCRLRSTAAPENVRKIVQNKLEDLIHPLGLSHRYIDSLLILPDSLKNRLINSFFLFI